MPGKNRLDELGAGAKPDSELQMSWPEQPVAPRYSAVCDLTQVQLAMLAQSSAAWSRAAGKKVEAAAETAETAETAEAAAETAEAGTAAEASHQEPFLPR